jgi:transposase
MNKTLFCGIDLHSNNAMYVITDQDDKPLFKRRLPNQLPVVLAALEPFRERLKVVAVESTYNWYWLVDRLLDYGYPVSLANPAKMEQYDGIKEANDLTDAAFLAHLARLGILPTGYIYPQADRPVRDLLRRRMLLVRQRTGIKQSLQNMVVRQTGQSLGWRAVRRLGEEERVQLLGHNDCLSFVATHQVELIELLDEKIKQFEEKVLEHAHLQPAYECLLTMPGVGVILGLTIMLETGEIGRFKTVGDFTSYCRCVRATHSSNGKKKGTNNSRNGNAYLAWAFVEAVHHAIRCCPRAKQFYDRKAAKRNGALATKALAAKWSKAAYYMMKRQEAFDLSRVFG